MFDFNPQIDDYEETYDICPKCGEQCETYFDDDSRTWKSWCCSVWVTAECDACHGDGFVESADYHCDWVNYGPDETEPCPACHGMGFERSPHKPSDWEDDE